MPRRRVPAVPAQPGPFGDTHWVLATLSIGENALIELRRKDPTFPKPRRIGFQKYLYVKSEVIAYVEALPRIGEPVAPRHYQREVA